MVGGMEWHGAEGQVLVTQRLHLVHVERVDVLAVEKAKVPNVLPSWA